MTSESQHSKPVKKDLLEPKHLLPSNFSDPVRMLNHYESLSLERFTKQNTYLYYDMKLNRTPSHVLLSRDKKFLVIIAQYSHIYIYDFVNKTSLLSETSFISLEELKFTGSISCGTVCEKNKCLFVGSVTGQIGKIELDDNKDIKQSIALIKTTATSPATSILSLNVSNDGESLAYSYSGGVKTIAILTSQENGHLHAQNYRSAVFVGEKQSLFINKVGSQSSETCYEIREHIEGKRPLKEVDPKAHYCVKILQNRKHYVTLTNNESSTTLLRPKRGFILSNRPQFTECQVFCVDNHETPLRTLKLEYRHSSDFDKLQFHVSKGARFLFCYLTTPSILYIYDLKTEKTHQLIQIPGLALPQSKVVFAEDDSCLVLVQEDGKIFVCNLLLETDKVINQHNLKYFEGREESITLSDNENYLAYFQRNKDVEVLDLKRNQVILTLQKEKFGKQLSSASMKFSEQCDAIIIEYKFKSETDPHKTVDYSTKQTLPSKSIEAEIRLIKFSELISKENQNIENYTPKKGIDEREPLNSRCGSKQEIDGTVKESTGKSLISKVNLVNKISQQLGTVRPKSLPPQNWLDRKDSWYKKSYSFLHAKEDCKIIVISSSGTYLFAGFKDSTVKVYNFPALQEVYSWKHNSQKTLVSIKVSFNDSFILTAYDDGFVEIRDFNFAPQSSSQVPAFYSFERYLRLDKLPLEEGLKNSHNYHISHEQTILHLKSLANSDDLPNLTFNPASNMPFLRDKYNKTPLNYLLCHTKLDYRNLNAVATYVLEYMKLLKGNNPTEYGYVLESLSEILPILMLRLQPDLAAKYVDMVAPVRLVDEKKIDTHVFAKNKIAYFPDTEFKPYMTTLLREGQELMVFKELGLKLNYRTHSTDIMEYALALSELEAEDLFKLPAISHLVDYIWTSTRKWNFGLFTWFSILMILLSVYVGISDRNFGFEITILVLTSSFMAVEALQWLSLKGRYWKNLWNKIDLVSLLLIYAYVIFKLWDTKNELAENWIAAFMIFTGYMRLAAYLRLFDQTRQLIEVIVTIIKDMISFLAIMGLITIAFSIIFLKFLRSDQEFYLWHLYYSYQLWYGNTDGIPSDSPSVLVLECAIMFILPVVLLNLLVTLMGESRETVKNNAILTDAKTKLAMSIEALACAQMMKYKSYLRLRRSKGVSPEVKEALENEAYLYICIPKIQDKECKTEEKNDGIEKMKEKIEEMMQILTELKEQQSLKSGKMESKSKTEAPDGEFKLMKELINNMKTELRQQISKETSDANAQMKEHINQLVKSLKKSEVNPAAEHLSAKAMY